MAWRCSGRTNEELVNNLHKAGIVASECVRRAMLVVDRAHFCSVLPYEDKPIGIGANATISAPHMHAEALSRLAPVLPASGARILDVGSGSGYLTVCLSHLAGPSSMVIGIDHIDSLCRLTNIRKGHADLLQTGRIQIVTGDGRQGYAAMAPYHAIHVGAAAETVPAQLTDQLAEGGRLLIPVGREGATQDFLQIDKKKGKLEEKILTQVVYVPLTSRERQLNR